MLVTLAFGIPLGLLWLASAYSVLCLAFSREVDDAPTLDALIARCVPLHGWDLVERAQREVHAAMPDYGFCNGFDTPRMALARRRGQCWQRALVLRAVLRARGVEARVVRACANRFEGGSLSEHTWLEVRIDGETRAVCPGDARNSPGVVRFRSISRVRRFGAAMIALSWLGGPIANVFAALVHRVRGGRVRPVTGASIPLRTRVTRSALWPLLPILAWNAGVSSRLPSPFADDGAVPVAVLAAEAVGRVFVFGVPLVLVLGLREAWQRRGLAVFVVGTTLYLLSWLPPLLDPTPSWLWLLPYVLPATWLLGLGLMARSGGFMAGSMLFAIAHAAHGILVIGRVLGPATGP